MLVDTLSTVLGLDSARIQFTPDLMPADILGSEVLDMRADGTRAFRFVEGQMGSGSHIGPVDAVEVHRRPELALGQPPLAFSQRPHGAP